MRVPCPRRPVLGCSCCNFLAAASRLHLHVKWPQPAQRKKEEERRQRRLVTRSSSLEGARSLLRRCCEAGVDPRCTDEPGNTRQRHFMLRHRVMQRYPGNTRNLAISWLVVPACMEAPQSPAGRSKNDVLSLGCHQHTPLFTWADSFRRWKALSFLSSSLTTRPRLPESSIEAVSLQRSTTFCSNAASSDVDRDAAGVDGALLRLVQGTEGGRSGHR